MSEKGAHTKTSKHCSYSVYGKTKLLSGARPHIPHLNPSLEELNFLLSY